MNKRAYGFTIVELLIVIVVIATLAAISVVAYTGIQNRANDSSVQSDLRNIGMKINEHKALYDTLPSFAWLASSGLRLSYDAYGYHYNNLHNAVYCTKGSEYVVVAASKSSKVYAFKDGAVREGVGPLATYTTTCPNNGLTSPTSVEWLYFSGTWRI